MAESESTSGIKKLWHDPVWSKVIGGLILASVTGGSYFAGWWPAIFRIFKRVFSFALAYTPVPNWLLTVLSLSAILTLCFLLLVIFPARETPDWRSYTSDNFFGILWFWQFSAGGQLYAEDIQPRCPKCLSVLEPAYDMHYKVTTEFAFVCDHCDFKRQFFDLHDLRRKIIKEVDRKIVSGEYKSVLAQKTRK